MKMILRRIIVILWFLPSSLLGFAHAGEEAVRVASNGFDLASTALAVDELVSHEILSLLIVIKD